jgi:enamidase
MKNLHDEREQTMDELLIENIGQIVSGDLEKPLLDGDAVVIRGGKIAAVGNKSQLSVEGISNVINAGGCSLWPGLIDSHVHPVFGDYTPRQNMLGFMDSCLHGGVTRMISAGEVHLPGRPKDAAGLKALAILAAKSFDSYHPLESSHGRRVILAPEMTEADFQEMAAAGVKHLGEVGLGSVSNWDTAARLVGWAHQAGMKAMMHVGGASIPGSNVIGADAVLTVKPDVASHTNGGPTAPPIQDVERIIRESEIAIELVQCGNVLALQEIVGLIKRYNALERVIVGTDMPSGTGVIPLGILRTLSWICAFGGVDPAQAVAMATGNTARVYNLSSGKIMPGADADLILVDAPIGAQAADALGTLRIGDTPAIAAVLIDGQVKVYISRNTPPPQRSVQIPWLKAGGH